MNNRESMVFQKKRIIYVILLVVSAIFLAPFFWYQISSFIIEPALYFWWIVKQLIRVVPQTYYWIFLIGSLGIISIIFLLLYLQKPRKKQQNFFNEEGSIKSFAEFYSLSRRSYYFKWVIANRLARIAQEILNMNHGNSKGDPLTFSDLDGELPETILNYLEAGLDNTHMSYKPKKILRRLKQNSPLDVELDQIITNLESQME